MMMAASHRETDSSPARRGELRTCVGCGERFASSEMVRLVFADGGRFAVDLAGKLGGRGAWVQPRARCLEGAVKRGGFSRAMKSSIRVELPEIAKAIGEAYRMRIDGLISSANRARAVAMGGDACLEAVRNGGASLIILAHDAAGRRGDIEALAKKTGCDVIVHGDKARFGTLFGRNEVGVMAIQDIGLARAIFEAMIRFDAVSEVG